MRDSANVCWLVSDFMCQAQHCAKHKTNKLKISFADANARGTFSILSCRPKEGGLEPLCDYSTGPLVYGASVVTLGEKNY